jgi:hypothetical protein
MIWWHGGCRKSVGSSRDLTRKSTRMVHGEGRGTKFRQLALKRRRVKALAYYTVVFVHILSFHDTLHQCPRDDFHGVHYSCEHETRIIPVDLDRERDSNLKSVSTSRRSNGVSERGRGPQMTNHELVRELCLQLLSSCPHIPLVIRSTLVAAHVRVTITRETIALYGFSPGFFFHCLSD